MRPEKRFVMTCKNQISSPFFENEIQHPMAWKSCDLKTSDWRLTIPNSALEELDNLIVFLRKNPTPIEVLEPEDFDLGACAEFMKEVCHLISSRSGLAILSRLPVEKFNERELKQIYWVLSSMIARPVAQAFDGRLLYDVIDTGLKIGTRTRGDLTNQELSWHTDYGFNFPPPFIGLLVINTATKGGVSRVASMLTAHNILQKNYPNLLERLYEPFWWNRQGEHPDGDSKIHSYPIFSSHEGKVRGRFIKWLLYKGYELRGEPFDEVGQEALETMFEIMSDPAHHIMFDLAPGEIQFMNNFAVAHSRTDYVDSKVAEKKRHLVRIFLRNTGRRSYMG